MALPKGEKEDGDRPDPSEPHVIRKYFEVYTYVLRVQTTNIKYLVFCTYYLSSDGFSRSSSSLWQSIPTGARGPDKMHAAKVSICSPVSHDFELGSPLVRSAKESESLGGAGNNSDYPSLLHKSAVAHIEKHCEFSVPAQVQAILVTRYSSSTTDRSSAYLKGFISAVSWLPLSTCLTRRTDSAIL